MACNNLGRARRVLLSHCDPPAAVGPVPDGAARHRARTAEASADVGRRLRHHMVQHAGVRLNNAPGFRASHWQRTRRSGTCHQRGSKIALSA